MVTKHKSILPDIKKNVDRLNKQIGRTGNIDSYVANKLSLYQKDTRFLTALGKKVRLKATRNIGHASAFKYTNLIKDKFFELGMDYVPFILEYIETEKKQVLGSGKVIKIPKHNFTLHIDDMFVRNVNNRKISYHTWLTRKDPELGSRYYLEVLRGLARNDRYTSTPQWGVGGSLWKQYISEVPEIDREIPQINYDLLGSSPKNTVKGKLVIAHMSTAHHQYDSTDTGFTSADVSNKGFPKFGRYRQSFQHRDTYKAGDTMNVSTVEIDKFIENEQYIFSGNLNKFLTKTKGTGEIKIINEILTEVLGQFKEDLEKLGRTYADEFESMGGNRKAPKYKIEASTRSKWATKPKFPNIESILWWFINNKKGLASSTKIEEFDNLKSMKQKANFIDRAVFLIANGIYARKLGHVRKQSIRTRRHGLYGKAATIKHARKFKRYSEERVKTSKRAERMIDWRKLTSTHARGLEKRKKYINNRKDTRKDNR